jgi:uncharacterized protein involved in type VI secretion and phage assembly
MPDKDNLAFTECKIELGGSPVSDKFLNDVIDVVVDSHLRLPSMVTLRLYDEDLEWSNAAQVDIGKEIKITVNASGHGKGASAQAVLFVGEVTALEPRFALDGPATLVIRGYDKSHRLHRGRKTRTFLKSTDDAIFKKVAGEGGLSASAVSAGPTHEYVIQRNQTDMEFIQERARRIGFQVFVDKGTLKFQKPDWSGSPELELKIGDTLLRFEPRVTAAHQADEVEVRGWDSKKKEAIVATAKPATPEQQAGFSQPGGVVAKKAFGAAKQIVAEAPVATVDEAKAMAEGVAAQLSREFLQAEGTCMGDPRIQAGCVLKIDGTGRRFSGKYFVTSATHVLATGGDYTTTFYSNGYEPYTVGTLVDPEPARERREAPGLVTALVTNVNDPDKLGRVKVMFPWLGDSVESDWTRVVVPSGGGGRGFSFLPEVNDEVLVAFEHGDMNHPIILGSLWNKTDKPPQADKLVSGGKIVQRVIQSRSGHLFILDDTEGDEQIVIRDKTGKNEIVIKSKDNSLTITMEGDVTVNAKGKLALTAKQDVTIEGQNITLNAKQNVSAKGSQNFQAEGAAGATVKSNGSTKVEGTQVEVKGSAMGTFDGGGMAVVKGGLVKIN